MKNTKRGRRKRESWDSLWYPDLRSAENAQDGLQKARERKSDEIPTMK